MGRKLDALLGRNFKASKFKTIAKLAISRLAILKNQRQARYSHAKSDVIELLKLGHHERALLRVEYVMKEENMLDSLVIIESYCQLLIERVSLIQKNKECPDELKEAISSLIFASSRCSEFPELRKVREIFSLTFGREFAARAVELRNNCGVQPRIISLFSSRQPSLESRLKVLKDISTENGIILQLEEDAPAVVKEQQHVDQKLPEESSTFNDPKLIDDTHNISEELNLDEELSESVKRRKQYRDVAAAARDAFESATYAAVAARAAIELSKSESKDYDSDDDGGSNHLQGIISDSYESLTPNLQSDEYAVTEMDEGSSHRLGFDKVHPIGNYDSESEGEDTVKNNSMINPKEVAENERKAERGDTKFASSSNSDEDILSHGKQFPDSQCQNEKVGNEKALDDDDYDTVENQGNIAGQEHNDLDSNNKPSLPLLKYQHKSEYNGVDKYPSGDDGNNKLSHQAPKVDSKNTQNYPIIRATETKNRMTNTQSLNFEKQLHSDHSSTDWKKLSMRTIRSPRV